MPFTFSQQEREQALRDYKVTIEYKHLKQHAPAGVYLVPSLDDLRHFHGVIFVRRGPFTNGIFKFQVRLPETYNDVNTHPEITFSSYVYNPHVDPVTGQLDVTAAYPRWDPHRHYLVTVLTYLKKIFYVKTFGPDAKANIEAKQLSIDSPVDYRKQVDHCVRESQKAVFVNDPGCTARFTEEALSHQVLRDLLQRQITDPAQVNKQVVLNIIDKASKV
jgi:ubiquitin-protein ligase